MIYLQPSLDFTDKTIPAGKSELKDVRAWISERLWSKATCHPWLFLWDCYMGEKESSVISATVIGVILLQQSYSLNNTP